MTLVRADRVLESTTTTGTGTYTLSGAEVGYQAFSAVCSNADTIEYGATDDVSWEVGLGTYSGGTLARTSIYASSNGGSAVNWGTGPKNIFCDIPAHYFNFPSLKNRVVTAAGTITVAGTDGAIVVNKTVGAATAVNLPAVPSTDQLVTIKDGKGDAVSNNITVNGNGNNIDGASTYVIGSAYGWATFLWNATQWNQIG